MPGARKLEALRMIMEDSPFREEIVEALTTNPVTREPGGLIARVAEGKMTMEEVSHYIGGKLRQYIAAQKGVKVGERSNHLLRDAYAFWKSGVLLTPWYVLQNYWENFFRVMVGSFEPLRFAGWETAFPIGKVHVPVL